MGVNVTLYGGSAGFTSCQGGRGAATPLASFWFYSFSFPRIISSKDLAQFHSVFLSHFSRPATVRLDASLWTHPQPPGRRARLHFSHHRLGAQLHRRKNRASLSPRDDPRLHPRRSRRNLHAPAQPALPPPTGLSQTINERFRESRVTNCGARPLDFPLPRLPRRHRQPGLLHHPPSPPRC